MDKVIKVSNCQNCKFIRYDNEFGFVSCNLNPDEIRIKSMMEQLPYDKVHALCPLKQGRVIVELENKGDD